MSPGSLIIWCMFIAIVFYGIAMICEFRYHQQQKRIYRIIKPIFSYSALLMIILIILIALKQVLFGLIPTFKHLF